MDRAEVQCPFPCHFQRNPQLQTPRYSSPFQWPGREDNRTVNGTLEPRHCQLARGCKQLFQPSDTSQVRHIALIIPANATIPILPLRWTLRGAGSFFAQHIEGEMTRKRHLSCWDLVHHCFHTPTNPPVEEKLQQRAPHIVIFFGEARWKRAGANTSGLVNKRYLHTRLAVAGSKMARDQRRRVPGWSEWQCHHWRCMKSNLSTQHSMTMQNAPKHRPDSTSKEPVMRGAALLWAATSNQMPVSRLLQYDWRDVPTQQCA